MGVHVVSYRLIIPYLSVLVPVLVCTMEIPDIGKGSPDLGVLPSVEERTKAGIHHARYTTEEASRESALATCLNAGDDLMYDDNNTTQENEDATMEQDMIDDAGERVEDQFLNPSLGAWQKPYDVLILNAIRRCRKGATKHGVTRCEIIKYIKCKNPKKILQHCERSWSGSLQDDKIGSSCAKKTWSLHHHCQRTENHAQEREVRSSNLQPATSVPISTK